MPSVADELAALRSQSITKKNKSKLKDAGGLSTPEQEEAQIKDLNESGRVGNYSKDARATLNAGSKAADQDLEFRRKLAANKKQDQQKQQDAKQTLAAGTKAVDKTQEFQQASRNQKKMDSKKQQEAAENLQQFNEAKLKATAGSGEKAAADSTPSDAAANEPEEIEEIDDIPDLEASNDLAEMPTGMQFPNAAAAEHQPRILNRAEKKARKMMEKLNMKPVPGIARVTLKTAGNRGIYTIHQPAVFEKSGSYIVFGEARQGGGMAPPQQAAQAQAAAAAAAATSTTTTNAAAGTSSASTEPTTSGDVATKEVPEPAAAADETDETDLNPNDIRLVMSQASCSRPKAVAALKKAKGDLVNAIMELTE